MMTIAKAKPIKVLPRKSDVVDIKTEIAIAKFAQFDTKVPSRHGRGIKKVKR